MTALNRVFAKPEATDRWAIPYADFITLLFALFVVLYGSAQIDLVAKSSSDRDARLISPLEQPSGLLVPAELIASELVRADRLQRRLQGYAGSNPAQSREFEPLPPPEPKHVVTLDVSPLEETAAASEWVAGTGVVSEQSPEVGAARGLEPNPLLAGPQIDPVLLLERHIRRALPAPLSDGLLELTRTDFGIKIHIQESLLFNVASAQLEDGAVDLLQGIAGSLISLPYQIRVEGHTDNRPIQTSRFPSNWELSSARASRVVRVLMNAGLGPERLAALGFGEHRPIASNASAQGRRLNRRVSIVVLRAPPEEAL